MRNLIVSLFLAVFSTPAFAQGFEANFQGSPSGAITVGRISFSEEMLEKAEALGHMELRRLSSYLREDLEGALMRTNWHGMSDEETRLDITIIDAMPNRPTISQINARDDVHYTTRWAGGAAVEARLFDGDGMVLASFSYSWLNEDLDDAASYGIWTDTRLTFNRFANSVADALGPAPQPGT